MNRFLILFVLLPLSASAQPIDYYRFPMDIPAVFSANFGEIRTNRFHTGIDLKTGGSVGKQLRAAADGYVARVTVAPNGYGRAIYIAHPNGTTTVYAHLDRFTTEVENYLRAERYRLRTNDLDLFPPAEKFPVRKGDPIGFSGNSGASSGPHLHFEVRETATARTLNTIARGWIAGATKDTTKPTLVKLYHIDIDTLRGVPVHSAPRVHELKRSADGNYSLASEQPLKAGPTSYFVIEATDRRPEVTNIFGIFRVRMSVDEREKVVFEKDGVRFDETRYACASTLYELQRRSRNELVMLATKGGNRLGMYKKSEGQGVLRVAPDDAPREVKIVVEDDAQNAVTVRFTVVPDPLHAVPQTPAGTPVSDWKDFVYFADGMAINIPQGALYEPFFYTQQVVDQRVTPRADSIRPLSPLHKLGDGSMPLHKAARVTIAADVPEAQRARACLAKVAANGTLGWAGGKWENGAVAGSVRDFGVFCVVADTVRPTISMNFPEGADLTGSAGFTVTAKDNFSGIADFRGTIDGEWVIFERRASRGEFIHRFDRSRLASGTHTLEFRVRDGVGNVTVIKRTFKN